MHTLLLKLTTISAAAALAACTLAPGGEDCESCEDTRESSVELGATVVGDPSAVLDYIKASNTGSLDEFGSGVALSADGSTLAVAARSEASAATGIDGNQADDSAWAAGAVYVFARKGETWVQQAYLKASNTDAGDQFGYSIALSADGSTLAVGAVYEASAATSIGGDQADNSAQYSGAVYVFKRIGTAWSQQAYVKGSGLLEGSQFGSSVALSANGSTLAVGAYGKGEVYMFTRRLRTWSEQARIASQDDAFGLGVSLSADGSTLAVGAPFVGNFAGAVTVYRRIGPVWHFQARLQASNAASEDYFGWHTALSADGATLAVGAHGEDSAATGVGGDQTDNSAPSAGAGYVFARSVGAWSQQAYVKASNAHMNAAFGWSLALSADGSIMAVGALSEDEIAWDSGAVYVLARSGTTWSQQAYVKASNAGGWFGFSVALSADGSIGVAGASEEDSAATGIDGDQTDTSAPGAGAVFVLRCVSSPDKCGEPRTGRAAAR